MCSDIKPTLASVQIVINRIALRKGCYSQNCLLLAIFGRFEMDINALDIGIRGAQLR